MARVTWPFLPPALCLSLGPWRQPRLWSSHTQCLVVGSTPRIERSCVLFPNVTTLNLFLFFTINCACNCSMRLSQACKSFLGPGSRNVHRTTALHVVSINSGSEEQQTETWPEIQVPEHSSLVLKGVGHPWRPVVLGETKKMLGESEKQFIQLAVNVVSLEWL